MQSSPDYEKNKSKEAARRFGVDFYTLSLTDFYDKLYLEDGLYHIITEFKPIDILLKRGEGFKGKAILTFNGALSEKARKLNFVPNFTGLAIAEELKSTLVAISDPSTYLADDIYIGWYLGWKGFDLQNIISNIITYLSKKLVVEFCAFGGSGGGFASLYFLQKNDEIKKALVWNCQTSVEDYYPRFWKRYVEVGFDVKDVEKKNFVELMENNNINSSLLKNVDGFKGKNFIYLQNSCDWHLEKHAEPFIKKLGLSKNNESYYVKDNFVFFKGTWGDGHAVPPKEALVKTLSAYMNSDAKSIKASLSPYEVDNPDLNRSIDDREIDFEINYTSKGVMLKIINDNFESFALYEVYENKVFKKHEYSESNEFLVRHPISFVGYSYVLFCKDFNGAVSWKKVTSLDVIENIDKIDFPKLNFSLDSNVLTINVAPSYLSKNCLFSYQIVKNNTVHSLSKYSVLQEQRISLDYGNVYIVNLFVKNNNEVIFYKGAKINLKENWKGKTKEKYRLIISNGYNDLVKLGFKPRKDALPININSISWKHDDRNIEFSLHAMRFLPPIWGELLSTGRQYFFEKCIRYLFDWYDQRNKGKISKFYWYDMAVGIRAQHIAMIIELSEVFPLKDREKLLINKIAYEHVEKLSNPKLLGHGNHAVYQMIGLKVLLLAIGDVNDKKHSYCNKVIKDLLDSSFDDNFVNTENSPFYHGYNLSILSSIPVAAFPELASRISDVLHKGRIVKKWLTSPKGNYYTIGDTEGKGEILTSADLIEDENEDASGFIHKDFQSSGYQIVRTHPNIKSAEASFIVFHATNKSKIHSHCDHLSFLFFHKGVEVFIDPGKYTYENNELRKHIISDRAHNTFGLVGNTFYPEDMALSETALHDLTFDKTTLKYYLQGQAQRGSFTFHRSIEYAPDSLLIITDEVKGVGSSDYEKEIRLNFGSEIELKLDGSEIVGMLNNAKILKVKFNKKATTIKFFKGDYEQSLGWVSPSYNNKIPTFSALIVFEKEINDVVTTISMD